MWNNLAFVGVNAILNWTFVFGGIFGLLDESSSFHWSGFGFIGSPISLSISRILQPLVFWLYAFKYQKHHVHTWSKWDLVACKRHLKDYLNQALPTVGTSIAQTAI
jgi:MATE family multidrug resistance protein